MKSPARAGGDRAGPSHPAQAGAGQRGGPDISLDPLFDPSIRSLYSITWTMRLVRGSTSTVWPFTTV